MPTRLTAVNIANFSCRRADLIEREKREHERERERRGSGIERAEKPKPERAAANS